MTPPDVVSDGSAAPGVAVFVTGISVCIAASLATCAVFTIFSEYAKICFGDIFLLKPPLTVTTIAMHNTMHIIFFFLFIKFLLKSKLSRYLQSALLLPDSVKINSLKHKLTATIKFVQYQSELIFSKIKIS